MGSRAWRRGLDGLLLALTAVPSFVIGPLLIVVFAVALGWLPVSGNDSALSLVLPAVTLGIGLAAVLARMTSASLKTEIHRDYIRTVLAKGGGARYALLRHALRNALLPVVQIFFLQLGMVLTGAVLTEAVFGWPGLGNLLVDALHQRDYPVIQGCLLVISLTYMVCVLLADVVSALIDPRVRQ
jgi:peptide/nickel transport system permease protein